VVFIVDLADNSIGFGNRFLSAIMSSIVFALVFGTLVYFGYGSVTMPVTPPPSATATAQMKKWIGQTEMLLAAVRRRRNSDERFVPNELTSLGRPKRNGPSMGALRPPNRTPEGGGIVPFRVSLALDRSADGSKLSACELFPELLLVGRPNPE
jgi:hypothetical protein